MRSSSPRKKAWAVSLRAARRAAARAAASIARRRCAREIRRSASLRAKLSTACAEMRKPSSGERRGDLGRRAAAVEAAHDAHLGRSEAEILLRREILHDEAGLAAIDLLVIERSARRHGRRRALMRSARRASEPLAGGEPAEHLDATAADVAAERHRRAPCCRPFSTTTT